MIARFGRRWLPALASTLLTVTVVQTLPASAADDSASPRTEVDGSGSGTSADADTSDRDEVESDHGAWWLDEPAGSSALDVGSDKDAWWLDDDAATTAAR